MNVLGISAWYHDAAAALVVDGALVAAVQQERFSRLKNDPSFPLEPIRYCLAEAGLGPDSIDAVVFYEKPLLKFERIMETWLALAPRGFSGFRHAFPLWLKEKVHQKRMICDALATLGMSRDFWADKIKFSEHHLSHAASAFYPSPFESAAVLTIDGVGEWASASIGYGRGNDLEIRREIHFPHSLGLLYSAFTEYLGFAVNEGEYKLMGLAPYGRALYRDLIFRELINLHEDGSFRLNLRYFGYLHGSRMTNRRFHRLFGAPPRMPDTPLTQHHMDIAASIQSVLEECVFRLARHARTITGESRLCLAGGVALNCTANGRLLASGEFEDVWVQPAAGDAGGAAGAALAYYYRAYPADDARHRSHLVSALLGPEYGDEEIRASLDKAGVEYRALGEPAMVQEVARRLAGGEVIGWFQGRMEFGPRALGARSILASPRPAAMRKRVNRIKRREDFRPFAPAVLEEHASRWFNLDRSSPLMLFAVPALSSRRQQIPAVLHCDGSSRVQTVSARTHGRFHQLISAFHHLTDCPMVLNTSFNVRDEPIVMTPGDALRALATMELDALAIGSFLVPHPSISR